MPTSGLEISNAVFASTLVPALLTCPLGNMAGQGKCNHHHCFVVDLTARLGKVININPRFSSNLADMLLAEKRHVRTSKGLLMIEIMTPAIGPHRILFRTWTFFSALFLLHGAYVTGCDRKWKQTPWSRARLKKLRVAELSKEISNFMYALGLLWCSQPAHDIVTN